MKLRIAKKILHFSERGFDGMTTRQRRRENRVTWKTTTIGRAFDRLRRRCATDDRNEAQIARASGGGGR
jgi:hypothetical protein